MRITHPTPTPGPLEASGLTFVDGVAEVESLDDAARAVLTDHGFTFDENESDEARAKREAAEKEAAEKAAREQREAEERAAAEKAEAERLAAEKEAAEKAAAATKTTKAADAKK